MANNEVSFIPTIWSGAILNALQKKSVFENLCNKDYEGDVKSGNTVKIFTVNNPTISDYEENGEIDIENISGGSQDLLINQKKYFAFKVDDVIKYQSSGDLLGGATRSSGFAIADEIDLFIADLIKTNALNKKSVDLTTDKLFEVVADIGELLDKKNAPDNRFMVVSPTVAKVLNLELVDKMTDNSEIVTSGFMGKVNGLNIYKSNNVKNILFGCSDFITLAKQIEEVEKIRSEKTFADIVRGLFVYGAKITNESVFGSYSVIAGTTTKE